MRAAEGSNLSEANLELIRKNISGDGTMKIADTKNIDDPSLEGRIFLLITDEDSESLKKNAKWFPLFRTLSKAYH